MERKALKAEADHNKKECRRGGLGRGGGGEMQQPVWESCKVAASPLSFFHILFAFIYTHRGG
jgi:hypothetical protein